LIGNLVSLIQSYMFLQEVFQELFSIVRMLSDSFANQLDIHLFQQLYNVLPNVDDQVDKDH